MKRYLINFFDNDRDDEPFVIMTDKTEDELQTKTEEILERFLEERELDWNYDDLVEELEKAEFFKVVPVEGHYEIRA